ncbi:platelet endothelial aggregation receptor 1-like [Anguilla rostrata]|uniref:platelet endothelial aggregation receptor 1-like n=1 Tax=Anguilla rostrata TaxID=7938 RepID=UPI0030CBB9B6
MAISSKCSVALHLLGFLLDLAWPLDPSYPNVCSLWESYTTSVKESYAHPYDQVYEESCSDAWSFYKCTRHRITYKTAYRQAVKLDYRRRYQCCPGYYESGERCVPRCTKECVHGRCVAPDRCQCEDGWQGEDCSRVACDELHWGPSCDQPCGCKNGGRCHAVTGACQCRPGYRGPGCEDPCPAGTFGHGCLQQCLCGTGGSCDGETGECRCREGFTGTLCDEACPPRRCPRRCPCQNRGFCRGEGVCVCPPGWTGVVCTERCPGGRFGVNCSRECVCHNGGVCDVETGHCTCAAGFTGERSTYNTHTHQHCLCHSTHTLSCHPMKGECTCRPGWAGLSCNETCPQGFYGHGCQDTCLCLSGGVCDSVTGRCQCAPGYTGEHCESHCERGRYGKSCSLRCGCSPSHSLACSPIDGTCFCREGWKGSDCSTPCSGGSWGPGCNGTCQCSNGASCSPVDGTCGCTAGWTGALCDQPCPEGWYGPGCKQRCDCLHSDGCDGRSGQCLCLSGWTGPHCSQPCPEGTWGRRCNRNCSCLNSATCLRHNGTCVCSAGYWGDQCQHVCGMGSFGPRCATLCPPCSRSSAPCHHVTGECQCAPGYAGILCEQACPLGYYGKQCASVCRCAQNSTCHHVDGSCLCPPGWTGRDCSEQCRPGTFGLNCAHACSCPSNTSCNPQTGVCVCASGLGDNCIRGRDVDLVVPVSPAEPVSWGFVAGIVLLVALVLLLLALLLAYRRRHADKQSRVPTVSYSATRTVNSEYMVPDVPHTYHHYYYNPSYHTLSQNRLPLPQIPNNQDRSIKNTNNQLSCNGKNAERERLGLFGMESNATLPAGWKHDEAPAPKNQGAFGMDRSHSYSASLGKFYNKGLSKDSAVTDSNSSLNSENLYATIKDLPSPLPRPQESGYMEMTPFARPERSYAEISLPPPPPVPSHRGAKRCSLGNVPEQEPQSHYDLPVNSHIPGHYDLPPVRRPPSPKPRRHPR